MKKGEIWVSDFWDGHNAVLIGDKIGPDLWNCTYLIKVSENTYTIDRGGRVMGDPDYDLYYSGNGQIIESAFTGFYHVEKGIRIIDLSDQFVCQKM